MLHTILLALGVLVVAAVAAGYVVLVVGDVRRTNGEPPSPDTQRNLDAQRAAERRVNRGGYGGAW